MRSLIQTRCALLAALTSALIPVSGATPSEDADLLATEKLPSLWVKTVDFRTSAGYKDNILLGNQNTVGSPLLGAGVDFTAFRLPLDGWEIDLFTSGEYIRYLTSAQVDHEATAIVQGQLKRTLKNDWHLSLSAEYVYFDQVFDDSVVSTVLLPVPVEGHGLSVRPGVGKDFAHGYYTQLEFPATRQFFDQFIDNYWQSGPALTFGWRYGHKSELSGTYQFNALLYDTRQARAGDGTLETQGLRFFSHELLVNWRHSIDQENHWRATTKLSLMRNLDNGGGYYDFWRPSIAEQLRYESKTWQVQADAKLSYYAYDQQRVDDLHSPIRHKTYLRVNLRGEKSLTKHVKLFGQYEYERALSNLSLDQYEVNTVTGGIEWEF